MVLISETASRKSRTARQESAIPKPYAKTYAFGQFLHTFGG